MSTVTVVFVSSPGKGSDRPYPGRSIDKCRIPAAAVAATSGHNNREPGVP
jgi:hypothetical protein